jgi:hypothetical protein
VKVAAPSAGGSGFRTVAWPLVPQYKKQLPNGDVELYRATLGFESYAPHIEAPLLYLGATNDFHGIMDDTYHTGALIPHGNVRYAFAPHLNHRFTPESEVTRPLWLDQHLKGTLRFPTTPQSKLVLDTPDRVPRLDIVPDASMPVERVLIYYSLDPDPRPRFWRSAEVTQADGRWTAKLPSMSLDQPLFAFANVYYRLHKPEPLPFAKPAESFAISSLLHTATSDDLRRAGVQATDEPSFLLDDFSQGFRDWYLLSGANPHHWQYWTRKINDPKWRGRPGYRLTLDVRSERPNKLVVVLTENFFRPYRGKQRDFVAVVELKGGETDTISLLPKDFRAVEGTDSLSSWNNVDLLGLRAYYDEGGNLLGSKLWSGPQPKWQGIRWAKDSTKEAEGR